jgi:hypothetical protein
MWRSKRKRFFVFKVHESDEREHSFAKGSLPFSLFFHLFCTVTRLRHLTSTCRNQVTYRLLTHPKVVLYDIAEIPSNEPNRTFPRYSFLAGAMFFLTLHFIYTFTERKPNSIQVSDDVRNYITDSLEKVSVMIEFLEEALKNLPPTHTPCQVAALKLELALVHYCRTYILAPEGPHVRNQVYKLEGMKACIHILDVDVSETINSIWCQLSSFLPRSFLGSVFML